MSTKYFFDEAPDKRGLSEWQLKELEKMVDRLYEIANDGDCLGQHEYLYQAAENIETFFKEYKKQD